VEEAAEGISPVQTVRRRQSFVGLTGNQATQLEEMVQVQACHKFIDSASKIFGDRATINPVLLK